MLLRVVFLLFPATDVSCFFFLPRRELLFKGKAVFCDVSLHFFFNCVLITVPYVVTIMKQERQPQ